MDWGFGAYLREYREKHRLSQDDLSRLTDIKQTEISKWERGILHIPGQEKAKHFAERMGVPLAEIANAVYKVPRSEFIYPDLREISVSPQLEDLLQARPSPKEAGLLLQVLEVLRDAAEKQERESRTLQDVSDGTPPPPARTEDDLPEEREERALD